MIGQKFRQVMERLDLVCYNLKLPSSPTKWLFGKSGSVFKIFFFLFFFSFSSLLLACFFLMAKSNVQDPFSSTSRTKARCRIDVPVEALLIVLLDLKGRKVTFNDFPEFFPSPQIPSSSLLYFQKWDSSLLDLQTLGSPGPDCDEIYYTAIKSPSGVSNRDFVKARRFKRLENNSVAVIEKSVLHPKFPPRKG